MDSSSLISFLFISIINSFFFNLMIRYFARKYKLLIDIPNKNRKFHKRPTPMTGGLSIMIGIILMNPEKYNPFNGQTVIVDEIHNLISEMTGKGFNGPQLYEMLMRAENMKLIGYQRHYLKTSLFLGFVWEHKCLQKIWVVPYNVPRIINLK